MEKRVEVTPTQPPSLAGQAFTPKNQVNQFFASKNVFKHCNAFKTKENP